MRSVMHLLPHPGGGSETYLQLLADMEGWRHERRVLSNSRNPATAAVRVHARLPLLLWRSRSFDLVHVHGDASAFLALPLIKRRPSVVTTHGLHLLRRSRGPGGRVVRTRLRRAFEAARVVVCCSETERQELEALTAGRARLVVVPNGIDLAQLPDAAQRSRARAVFGLKPEEVAVLYLGQLEPRKDPLTAVAAAERAAASGAALRLLLAGDGPLLDDVRAAAGPATRVLGFRDDAEVLLRAADVFLMPSLREGASFAVLEAMGMALPMVVSDGIGNPELVGDSGIVFPVGDVDELAAALAKLAASREERQRAGLAARDRVAARFRRDVMRDGVRAAYEEAVKLPGRVSVSGPA